MSHTVVCFHAHPDDEALYTGGTMARLAAEGHRVVLVTATAGEAGLASSALTVNESLGAVRRRELAVAAAALGCARVVGLGYPDSGLADQPHHDAGTFAGMDSETVARRLAQVLDEEQADAVTIYDPAGGYGHPDHRQVHRAGSRAAELAGTAVVLQATVDRRALQRALRAVSWTKGRSSDFRPRRFDSFYTPPDLITHRVDVSAYLDQKREAMQAHLSQTTSDDTGRALAWFLRLPGPLFRLAFGREWFVESGRRPAQPPLDDVLTSLTEPRPLTEERPGA